MKDLDKAKETLGKIKFVCLATVNEDNTPHCSPLVFLFDENLDYVYWGSHPESLHSKNILRTRKAYFVAFDGVNGSTGVYIDTNEAEMVNDDNLEEALRVHNHFRNNYGKDSIERAYYTGESPQRMWRAKVTKVWINAAERQKNGHLTKDYKIELNKGDFKDLWS